MELSRELVRDALGVGAWAYLGVTIRYWLGVMSDFQGFPGFDDLYANLIGSMILGFATSHKNFLSRSPPTSVGITTGLCGSITTFSSWQFLNAKILTDWFDLYSTSENVLISVTNQIVGVSACLSTFLLGRHLAMISSKNNDRTPAVEGAKAEKEFWLYLCVIIATTVLTLGLAIFAPGDNRLDLVFSVFFAPVGAITRWAVSLVLNKPGRWGDYQLPYGTLVVNITGVFLLAIINIIIQEHRCFADPRDPHAALKGGIAAGFGTGFCGCLTTVSTWISELHSLPLERAYIYGALSIAMAQLLLVSIIGGYRWSFEEGGWEMCP